MTTTSFKTTTRRSSLPPRTAGFIGRMVEILERWYERSRQRKHLASLDDRMLRDIGISRADVDREYFKPFWRT